VVNVNKVYELAARLERVRLDIINRPPADALSVSLETFYKGHTEADLMELAAALESDPV
jgi:hypothetical protein